MLDEEAHSFLEMAWCVRHRAPLHDERNGLTTLPPPRGAARRHDHHEAALRTELESVSYGGGGGVAALRAELEESEASPPPRAGGDGGDADGGDADGGGGEEPIERGGGRRRGGGGRNKPDAIAVEAEPWRGSIVPLAPGTADGSRCITLWHYHVISYTLQASATSAPSARSIAVILLLSSSSSSSGIGDFSPFCSAVATAPDSQSEAED